MLADKKAEGKRRSIVTVAERISKKVLFRQVPNKKPDIVANATINVLKPYKNVVKSITADNGFEFRNHEKISQQLESEFYFAHPYSSWEQGLNSEMHCVAGEVAEIICKSHDLI